MTSVAEVTGFPEILDGRVKTLHPAIHGGLLARRDKPEHMAELAEHGITGIDLVASNLYPFEATVEPRGRQPRRRAREHRYRRPDDAARGREELPRRRRALRPGRLRARRSRRCTTAASTEEQRRALAAKAFQHVALYDTLVARYLRGDDDAVVPCRRADGRPAQARRLDLHYGENPHQTRRLYEEAGLPAAGDRPREAAPRRRRSPSTTSSTPTPPGARSATSPSPTVAIIKHTNPCGLASHEDLTVAYERALAGDPISAFGGIVACNRPIDGYLARAMRASISPSSGQRMRYDIIIAPGYSEERPRGPDALARRAHPRGAGGRRHALRPAPGQRRLPAAGAGPQAGRRPAS